MTRVSENSTGHAVQYALGKTKSRLEDLQIQGSNLKRIQKPSDDPVGNVELLAMRSQNLDGDQYLKNANYASIQLNFAEVALNEISDVLLKAKEIAIGQSSNFYNEDVRKSVAREVEQLSQQVMAIANRRIGNRYIFGGHKTLDRPFDNFGNYFGDEGQINLEISKDFFVPINMSGREVFFESNDGQLDMRSDGLSGMSSKDMVASAGMPEQNRMPSSTAPGQNPDSIFTTLNTLENALVTNNPEIIQSTLDKLDTHYNRVTTLKTEIGSLTKSIQNNESFLENAKIANETYKTKVEDADIAELFTDLEKQKNVLKATYQTTATMLNRSLLDFLR